MLRLRRPALALLAVVSTAAGFAACGGEEPQAEAPAPAAPAAPGGPAAPSASAAPSRPLEHIHGLGVNPADGRLFIATHNGLFAAREGERTPRPVGESGQDIMGFSVVGPDRFIGSGHPGPGQEDLPPNLGLIASGDGGRRWRSVSLLGEADFHALESAGRTIYGVDGLQGLLVSTDGGERWQRRTPPAVPFALAIDPRDATRVIAATEQGLLVSADAGRSWNAVNRERAGLLAWAAPDRLFLVDADGQVQVSADGGRTWRTRGALGGQPVAFIAHEGELLAALPDGTVKRSTDGGASWTVRTTPA